MSENPFRRFVKPKWVRAGKRWEYRPGGIFVRAVVARRRTRWTVETTWFSLKGFATLRDARAAAAYLWRQFPSGFETTRGQGWPPETGRGDG